MRAMMPSMHLPTRFRALVAGLLVTAACGGDAAGPAFSDTPNLAGMQALAEQSFDCIKSDTCPTNWFFVPGITDAFAIVADASAPRSPSSVLQQNFTSALSAGSSPGAIGLDFPPVQRKRTLYASMWMKLSSDFVGHPTSINKAVFFVIAANNRVYTMSHGVGDGPLQGAIGLQGLAAPYTVTYAGDTQTGVSVNLMPNLANVPIVRGQWQRYEVVFVANTPGFKNGTAEMWIDGTKILEYSGIMYAGANESAKWENVHWDPTWGGIGGAISAPFYSQMDHMYISGR